jgi:hypothetical protein
VDAERAVQQLGAFVLAVGEKADYVQVHRAYFFQVQHQLLSMAIDLGLQSLQMLAAYSPDQADRGGMPVSFSIRNVMGLRGGAQVRCRQSLNHCYFIECKVVRNLWRAAFSALA